MRCRADHDHGHSKLLRAAAAKRGDGAGKGIGACVPSTLNLRSDVLVLMHQYADRSQTRAGPGPLFGRPTCRGHDFRFQIAAVLTDFGFDGVRSAGDSRFFRVNGRGRDETGAQNDGHSHGASLGDDRLMRD